MCQGGRLLADFVAGTRDQPNVPELAGNLTHTVEGEWLVWAYKLARPQHDGFVPLTGRGGSYPADAQAECSVGPERRSVRIPAAAFAPQRGALLESRHSAPDPACSCGFHALSNLSALNFMGGPFPRRNRGEPSLACLAVVLSGRVLAFEWPGGPGTVLFRAARQTVVSVAPWPAFTRTGEEAVDCGASPGRFDPEPRVVAKGPRRPRRSAGPSPLGAAFRKWSRTAATPLRARSGCGR